MTLPDPTYVHRTYEPLKFLSRLSIMPMTISKGTWPVSLTVTHEVDPPWRWAPTVVFRLGWLPLGFGIGWWLNSDVAGIREEFQKRVAQEAVKAEYDRYCAINGQIPYMDFLRAWEAVSEAGGNPEDELEIHAALSGLS